MEFCCIVFSGQFAYIFVISKDWAPLEQRSVESYFKKQLRLKFDEFEILFAGICFDVNCVQLHSMCLQITQERIHRCNEVSKKITAYNITPGLQLTI
jgi:hypothetical protein